MEKKVGFMNAAAENTITVGIPELEAIIQRAVQEAVRKEMKHVLFDFRTQADENTAKEDEVLLRDAMKQIDKYGDDHSGFITLEDLRTELANEANGLRS
ncbi:MAG: hypothetical protein ACREEM_51215 [Blastocatellia bacterium]